MNSNDKTQCSTEETACATKRCCPVKCLLTALAVFVIIFLFETVFHGVFMMPYYKATAALWRPEADMHNFMYVTLIRQIGTALAFTCVFGWMAKKSTCGCPIQMGAKFGFKIGLLLGLASFGAYAYIPFPSLEIPVLWLLGYIVEGVLMGIVAGVCCKMSKKNTPA